MCPTCGHVNQNVVLKLTSCPCPSPRCCRPEHSGQLAAKDTTEVALQVCSSWSQAADHTKLLQRRILTLQPSHATERHYDVTLSEFENSLLCHKGASMVSDVRLRTPLTGWMDGWIDAMNSAN